MSKKLLEESTVRSFMKLANLQPLTQKFITEKFTVNEKEEKGEKEDLEEEVQEESAPPDTDETAKSRDRLEEEDSLQEEVLEEEGEDLEEGKESEGRPASKKEAPKGTSLAGKPQQGVDGAKSVKSPGKLKAAPKSSHHSDKADSVEAGPTPKNPKNNSVFELHESLEEMEDPNEGYVKEADMDSPEGGEMSGGAESGPHKDKMKGLIRDMLNNLKQMGEEYGMTMEISDEGAGGEPEAPEAEAPMGDKGDEMMQEKLDEMVEKLTKRVAARLVKESKKKR